ncbi:Fe/S biogenesis protein NfuA [Limihaloglobus sulfuriphilus]|uniref:Fe/S biogenesis protein NfuA n=1 Tax=Limihaloglobus sulfuriphilus TaxID=1851148 RepID=A0A1Q2MF01_9BACT|nr:Fe/S biogenesis protein NfuA [Limihaloglobus sulfuriphilus]
MTTESNGNAENNGLHAQITETLMSIRPSLQSHGGDLELVEITDDLTVKVKLQGACHGCPGARATLKNGVERVLKERVPMVKEVIAVN